VLGAARLLVTPNPALDAVVKALMPAAPPGEARPVAVCGAAARCVRRTAAARVTRLR
jgi:hypothetical protein